MGQADDDGIDGLVYLRTKEVDSKRATDRRSWKHQFTGGVINVQVKSGSSYVTSKTKESFKVTIDKMDVKREFWQKSPLPVVLVYVQDEPQGKSCSKAWWADLKSDASYTTEDKVIVDLKNRFQAGLECRRPFARLATGQHRLLGLEHVNMSTPTRLPGKLDTLSKSLKEAAWEFYDDWKKSAVTNPELGEILVNRTGWAHITRVGRPKSRIQASFDLLPAAARIVATVTNWKTLKRGYAVRNFPDKSCGVYDYLGLSAIVKWPARAPSEVMVILRRLTIFKESVPESGQDTRVEMIDRKIWFYSVYEPGRGKKPI